MAILLAVAVLAVAAPFVKALTAQPASRLALTAAVVDHGTIWIDAYRDATLPVDRIETPEGRLLSDKAPAQPLLATPAYALARLVGADPAEELRPDANLTAWWVTVWSAVVPLAVVAVLVYRRAAQLGLAHALPAALALTFGTFLLPFGTELYGHVLAGALAYGGWLALAAPAGPARSLAAGFLLGGAVAVEYPLALVVAVVAAVVAWRDGVRALGWVVVGAAPCALAVAWYQYAAFGSPWRSSYGTKFATDGSGGFPTAVPGLDDLTRVVFGSRGLFLAPVVLLAVWGAVGDLRRRAAGQLDGVVALGAFAALFLLTASWPNPWGGSAPGPRYLVPSLPFLGVPLASAWARRPFLARSFTAVGVAAMCLALLTFTLIHPKGGYVSTLSRRLLEGDLAPTIFTIPLGGWGWLVHGALVAAAFVALATAARATPDPSGARLPARVSGAPA